MNIKPDKWQSPFIWVVSTQQKIKMFGFFKKKQPELKIAEDIKDRIENDFGNQKVKAIKLISDYLTRYDYLNSDRILRCIVFLANKKVDQLKSNLDSASEDWRDVMLWAEYENPNDSKPKQVRDFNKPFGEEELK